MDKPPPRRRALAVHAGAWDIPPAEMEPHRLAVIAATEAGWQVLLDGGEAVEAVEVAIHTMEANPALNAGHGSVLNRDGHVELDAGLMDGRRLLVGGVTGLRHVAHPIAAAARVMRSKHVLLAGTGAEAWLTAQGHEMVGDDALVTPRERERLEAWRARGRRDGPGESFGPPKGPADTVGAVAIDLEGGIAAGASTGGMCGKPLGRVGDTPIPGAGYYADHLAGGASCTGWGEALLRQGTARRAVELCREGNNAVDACWLAVRELDDRFGGKGGLILIGRDGTIGYGFNTPHMAAAYCDDETEMPVVIGPKERRGHPRK